MYTILHVLLIWLTFIWSHRWRKNRQINRQVSFTLSTGFGGLDWLPAYSSFFSFLSPKILLVFSKTFTPYSITANAPYRPGLVTSHHLRSLSPPKLQPKTALLHCTVGPVWSDRPAILDIVRKIIEGFRWKKTCHTCFIFLLFRHFYSGSLPSLPDRYSSCPRAYFAC